MIAGCLTLLTSWQDLCDVYLISCSFLRYSSENLAVVTRYRVMPHSFEYCSGFYLCSFCLFRPAFPGLVNVFIVVGYVYSPLKSLQGLVCCKWCLISFFLHLVFFHELLVMIFSGSSIFSHFLVALYIAVQFLFVLAVFVYSFLELFSFFLQPQLLDFFHFFVFIPFFYFCHCVAFGFFHE